jgi:hypothetical protein
MFVKAFRPSLFACQNLNFEQVNEGKSHLVGKRCSQAHIALPKDEASSDGICETSTHRGGLCGFEEYRENLKKQEQSLKQELQDIRWADGNHVYNEFVFISSRKS